MSDEAVNLAFFCRAETWFGQHLRVVGSIPELGNWNPALGLELACADHYPNWTSTVACDVVSAAKGVDYKYVKYHPHSDPVWEEGDNRFFSVNADGDVCTRSGRTAEPVTPKFGIMDLSAPRLTEGRSRKTSFSDEVDEYAVPVPVTPKNKVPTSLVDFNDELHFSVVCAGTGLGDYVSVVGSCEELGKWDIKKGAKLCTSPDLFPTWAGTVHIKSMPFREVEFKAVIMRLSGRDDWEANVPNRDLRSGVSENDQEGPWQAFWGVSVYGTRVAKFRTTPIDTKLDSKEDPTLVKAALQDSNRKHMTVNGRSLHPYSATAGCNEPRRSTSLSLLAERVPLVAEHWGRCKDLTGPPLKEQCLLLKLKGIEQSDAQKMSVEVVFEVGHSLCLSLTSWTPEELQASWSLAVTAADLEEGTHFFHFRVNGVFALSAEHIRIGRWNALHHSDSIRRYLLARDSQGQLLEDGMMVERTRSKQIGDMACEPVVGDAASAVQTDAEKEPALVRPYSVCGTFAGSSTDEPEKQDAANAFAPFAIEVYEGLFDRELMLRLQSVALPEAPQPPLTCEGEDPGCALRLWAGAHLLKKAHGACEDAYFVDPHGMGVADGVGCMVQFASYGINAAQYATELMEFSAKALKDGIASEKNIPNDVASRAATAMKHAESQAAAYGASTVAVLCQQGNFAGVANLGDSGFMLLRKGENGMYVAFKSEEQQHSWNCPYQLTRLPKTLLTRFPKLQLDKASDCERYTVPIREGDLLVMFSDGLRDNLHDREVVSLVNRTLPPLYADLVGMLDRTTSPDAIAKVLALAAQERSMDPSAKVPFVEYSKRHGFECIGGKQDDITVVCAWVVADESVPCPDFVDVDEIVEDMLLAEEAAEEERLEREAAEAAAKAAEEERLRQEAEAAAAKAAEEERLRQEAEAAAAKAAEEERVREESTVQPSKAKKSNRRNRW